MPDTDFEGEARDSVVATVVVPTRDRPESMRRAALSILRGGQPDIELIVVDQSDGEETARTLAALGDSRVRIIRPGPIGKSAAANLGLRAASADIVAFTDDDCEVAPTFVSHGSRILRQRSQAAMVCFSVRAAPFDPALGWVERREFSRNAEYRGTRHARRACGLGASLVVRKAAVLSIGGFDEQLGPGALFPAAEENDLAFRVLLSGKFVVHSTESFVTHHGFRTHAEGRTLAKRNFTGIGAVAGKYMKSGNPAIWSQFLAYHTTASLAKAARAMVHTGRPSGASDLLYLWMGVWRGLRQPLDRQALLFTKKK